MERDNVFAVRADARTGMKLEQPPHHIGQIRKWLVANCEGPEALLTKFVDLHGVLEPTTTLDNAPKRRRLADTINRRSMALGIREVSTVDQQEGESEGKAPSLSPACGDLFIERQ